jgi:glycine cleavage system regulatory protein
MIIHAVASDRVGIVSDLTKFVTEMGGSVGESQASRLGSHFSLMMLVHNIPENQVVALVDQFKDVENIAVSIHMVQSMEKTPISHSEIGCK